MSDNRTLFVEETITGAVKRLLSGRVYQDWCEDNNEHACSERFLGLRLKELGLEQKRLPDGRYWKGVKVRSRPG